ncbi:hypothetical protein SAMN05446927_6562 [Caballeronia arationis]|jgi:hypothetical protein|uniref:Uncharacterized protein n=1 Tax=Caballeronia arationis TaxID=1777142 RepID=A0A7Z7N6G3_9BURK|nr:hypothetical protein [Caballeronia arationis]SOE87973.1 hypothetical protein SAMN05446927_6562 [Caballeronia arationis]
MAVRFPDAVILDLRQPISEYEKEVKHLGALLDTGPAAMVSWLSCYIDDFAYADDQVDNAVMDIACSDHEIPEKAMGQFSDAALGLGLAMVDELRQKGIFTPEEGRFPYSYVGLIGKSVIVRRIKEEG